MGTSEMTRGIGKNEENNAKFLFASFMHRVPCMPVMYYISHLLNVNLQGFYI